MSRRSRWTFEPPAPDEQEDAAPSEVESALLTIVLFGGLVFFAIGCMMFLW